MVEEVQAVVSVYSVGTVWLSLGATGTVRRFQAVESASVTER